MTAAAESRLASTLRLFLAGLLTVLLLFPVYWMAQTSILPTSSILSRNPDLLPKIADINLSAFETLVRQYPVARWFLNSAMITVGSALLSTLCATLAGYSLSRFKSRTASGIAFVLLLGRVLPGTLLVLPYFVLFRWAGILDTHTAVILANASMIIPFATFMMKNYFDDVPRELDEAAKVDGCSAMTALWFVVLPIARPGMAATVAFAATASWVDLLFARTLLLSAENWTVPVGIASLIGEVQTSWNQLMAAGVLSVLPVFAVYWFAQPYLVGGMTSGAVKG
ncbi:MULTISPECIES: carbohydrate ABC transporter permease [unclassified Chelatococcus]|jgi:multiple sugar transport system permease protein|uniref:carbohydrate ABC transporter permease n=1 Tax=unclassified Chelatococcus TaxID=2638111 RepID=UPI001BCD3774|nr:MULTISPECIES: carbohydrate ABC transporter permease [unclassified Chelatococcus]CAH1655916.1 Multiple sugar transport system permease protein [Hyphomicrobiales bacterium]MBS7742535.1 carbohydrate ABC transporter permease [Chelatococcus sp. HY11]MBX3542347.1 carbohydrate ABC transporter permease [Chelatococcus sp.]MCO5075435.1 carbohydrate ABC transporter permease [Chelatococcus sp.]CAH1695679.1 Multiple sugar transport system permease protein [Hyphomicrobiales bacterium]